MPRCPVAFVCACLLGLPAHAVRSDPPTPAVAEATIDDAYDDGFWRGVGGPLIVGGGFTAIPGLTGAIAGAVEGRGDVIGLAAVILAIAGAQIGVGAWLVLDTPEGGPAAARSAGQGAGAGLMIALYGAVLGAATVAVLTSDAPLSDTGGELLAVPISALMIGFGAADHVSGTRAHRALVDGARSQPVSGLRHVPPDDRPRLSVVRVLSGSW